MTYRTGEDLPCPRPGERDFINSIPISSGAEEVTFELGREAWVEFHLEKAGQGT